MQKRKNSILTQGDDTFLNASLERTKDIYENVYNSIQWNLWENN